MVVHNALDVVRISTLRTLRYIAGQSARLVVVDNGSTDGSGEWLSMLARRGDIDLIRNDFNIGHGPALELARRAVRSPYLVTLDSDAFPVSDSWLSELRSRLDAHVKVAGILHHRGYIHPSCLMVGSDTMDAWKLTFLNEKSQPSRFDVGERISNEARRRGHDISGLIRTWESRRGSESEPVFLGSIYENLVYHHWYTTRSVLSKQVDDVPRVALDASLGELVQGSDAEPREVTVIVGVRAGRNEPDRLRNAKACLWALNLQSVERWRYRIVLVEQDSEPFAKAALEPLVDRYVFAYNPKAYNRGWAFNIGAHFAAESDEPLCLLDADILLPSDSLASGLAAIAAGRNAFQPFREVVFLDRGSTERAIDERLRKFDRALNVYDFEGSLIETARGGCLWVRSNLYHLIGGHDERFRGWGREDREFSERLAKTVKVKRLPGCILHLHHPRPQEEDAWALANRALYDEIREGRAGPAPSPIGSLDLYAHESAPEPARASASEAQSHFERIVGAERFNTTRRSTRWHLAETVSRLGAKRDAEGCCASPKVGYALACPHAGQQRDGEGKLKHTPPVGAGISDVMYSVLDVGCGPGALWPHLEHRGKDACCFGVDLDDQMISAAHRLSPAVGAIRADGTTLPFLRDGMDVVVLRHVLEHLDPEIATGALAEAFRVARKSVIVDFCCSYPADASARRVLVGESFFKDRCLCGWRLRERFVVVGSDCERDEIWVFMSPNEAAALDRSIAGIEAGRPKISIVMPTYRRSHTILQTLETVRAQTYTNWELIIVDNAGDGGYGFGDPRIRVVTHKVGPSSSHARNQGVHHATGDFICFFDDDDEMFPDYLEAYVDAFERDPRLKMVRGGMVVEDGSTNFSYATPEICLRRELATPTWDGGGGAQDQRYFSRIVVENDLALENGTVVIIPRALCRANSDPHGGLRNGDF
jgi:glycosyltransferase involved in cell wall biosynthesis/SAM-dependent methyltransferase